MLDADFEVERRDFTVRAALQVALVNASHYSGRRVRARRHCSR